MVPVARSRLRIGNSANTGSAFSRAGCSRVDELPVEYRVDAVVLLLLLVEGHVERSRAPYREWPTGRGACAFQCLVTSRTFEAVGLADHFVHRAEAEFGHDFAQFFGQERNRFTTCSGLPVKSSRSSLFWVATPTGQVLRWHLRIMMQPAVTRAAVATPHSSAPSRAAMARSRPVSDLPVGLHHYAAAQFVAHQRLVRFGQAQFPGQAGVADRAERRGAGAAVVAGNEHHVGVGFGNARPQWCRRRLRTPASR